jgi:polysaccharide deacetylase 2 family uncharacterized protein YibQ
MGSRLTECRGKMNEVLDVVEDNSLFFVDSFTSSHSIAYKEASRRHVPAAFRNIFLDNNRSEKYIIGQLRKLKKHAFKYGRAVGIGHPYTETAKAISHFLAGPGNPSDHMVYMSDILNA